MMDILERIVAHKRIEVANSKRLIPPSQLREAPLYQRVVRSLAGSLTSCSEGGVIAEFKRRSPSRPSINFGVTVQEVAEGYQQAGAAGMSVLTDTHFFGGSLDDLIQARATCDLPLLRKEFVIDPYQLHEARAHGADAILLIAAILEPSHCAELAEEAHALGLEVLLEVHSANELENQRETCADLYGVNNRNLKTFEVSLETSMHLIGRIPAGKAAVSESGLKSVQEVETLRRAGFQGFLIGEEFMRSDRPGEAAREWIAKMKNPTALGI